MSSISVGKTREKPKPPSSAGEKRTPRQKRMRNAKKILDDRAKEPPLRAASVGRISVKINASPTVIHECPTCGYEAWKWLIICPKCDGDIPA